MTLLFASIFLIQRLSDSRSRTRQIAATITTSTPESRYHREHFCIIKNITDRYSTDNGNSISDSKIIMIYSNYSGCIIRY